MNAVACCEERHHIRLAEILELAIIFITNPRVSSKAALVTELSRRKPSDDLGQPRDIDDSTSTPG